MNTVVKDTLFLASKYNAMEGVKLDLELCLDPLVVDIDTKQMQQVFANILLNAAEAADGENGEITIRTDEDSSGGFATISFTDNGKGISEDHIEKVFEPSFTNKEKGTGLGLSVSLGIVRRHDGTIEIESEPGRGTTVIVVIPKVDTVRRTT